MYRSVVGFLCATAMVTGVAAAAQPDVEAGGSTYSIDIVGYVPVICRASLDATVVPAAPGEAELGSLNEFCNSPSGYDVFVENSPELAGSVLYVDGQAVTLSASPTRISSSDQPAITSRNVRLANAGGSGGSLSFRIAAR
jgi:hypothetical protein